MSNSRNNSLLLFYLWPSGVGVIGFFLIPNTEIVLYCRNYAPSLYLATLNQTTAPLVCHHVWFWIACHGSISKRCVFWNPAASVSCMTYNTCSKAITTVYRPSYMVVKMTFAQWVSLSEEDNGTMSSSLSSLLHTHCNSYFSICVWQFVPNSLVKCYYIFWRNNFNLTITA